MGALRLDPKDPKHRALLRGKVNPETGRTLLQELDDAAPKKKPFFGGKIFRAEGQLWRSQWEYDCYRVLKQLEYFGAISDLKTQQRYDFVLNGVKLGSCIIDFEFKKGGRLYVADAKQHHTSKLVRWRWQLKAFKAFYGLDVVVLYLGETDVEKTIHSLPGSGIQ